MRIRGLAKRFPSGTQALEGIDLDVAPGEFVAVVGPSGCGKTTLLRIMAGLETHSAGSVVLDEPHAPLPARDERRALGAAMVFQDPALLPWLRVRDNIAFAFDALALSPAERTARIEAQLAIVGLSECARAYPHELSGGMRQRVAVARAFAVDPAVLFMDEPFGALDEQTRVGLQGELLRVWERSKKTVLFVTHSIEEAVTLADRIVVLQSGPGRIRTIVEVALARPRDPVALRAEPEFGRLVVAIWGLLRAA